MRRFRIAIVGVVLAAVVAAAGAGPVLAQWPTTCVDLNDIVEAHLGNDGNVGIYQRVFGDQAEAACQNDHRDDVRGVFAWAFADASQSADSATPDLAWPTSCVELNDIVESHLGNDSNVGIYQRVFLDQAEAGCRRDHLADVQATFAWARPPAAPTTGSATATILGPEPAPEPVGTIGDYANQLPELQQLLSQLPSLVTHTYDWLHDGISPLELSAIRRLQMLARDDPSLAFGAATSPWISDGILRYEESALYNLGELRQLNPELARQVLGYSQDPQFWPSDVRIIRGLWRLWEFDASHYDRLTSQPWFVDGLDSDERVFVDALFVAGIGERYLFDQLLRSHHRQSAIVILPLAGRVRLSAFQPQAFPKGEDLLGQIERSMRGAEQFMRVPFPTTDVVVLLGGIPAGYSNQRLRLARSGFRHISPDLITREVAHFYFTYDVGPHTAEHQVTAAWLQHGGVEFIWAYINGRLEPSKLPELLGQWEADTKRICVEHGLGNLHKLTIPDPPDSARWQECASVLGRYLLLRLYEALGEDVTSAALREIYFLASHIPAKTDEHGIRRPSEQDIYRIFVEHTPPSQRNVARHIFRSIHGGPFVDT